MSSDKSAMETRLASFSSSPSFSTTVLLRPIEQSKNEEPRAGGPAYTVFARSLLGRRQRGTVDHPQGQRKRGIAASKTFDGIAGEISTVLIRCRSVLQRGPMIVLKLLGTLLFHGISVAAKNGS